MYKTAYLAQDVPSVFKSKYKTTIIIDGTIFNNRLLHLFGKNPIQRKLLLGSRKIVHMPGKTQQLIRLVKAGNKEITIQLNSGGGLMNVGMDFVAQMKGAQQRGVKFTCIVDNHAMSMALIIFSECDTRYATFGSKIMWHSIARSGNMRLNVFKASKLMAYLAAKNEEVWANTRRHFLPWYFVEHFEKETILNVSEIERKGIGYLRVIDNFKIINKPQPKRKYQRKGK
jgi:ATP-dependent protease ClpP protease subunit